MTSAKSIDWCCVAAVNQPRILAENLAASPALVARPERLEIQLNQPSASIAYNRGIDNTCAEIVVFAHQDVYLPAGWDEVLARCVLELNNLDADWAVAGLIGLTPENTLRGQVWSTGLGRELGGATGLPAQATCIDELLIILRRSSNLRFDPALPSFHLYGTDIVHMALKAGHGAYIVHAPVIHNSRPVQTLEGGFTEAYRYLQKKLVDELPVQTLIAAISTTGVELRQEQEFIEKRRRRGQLSRIRRILHTDWRWLIRAPSARTIAHRLGYEGKQR